MEAYPTHKPPNDFECIKCNFKTSNKKDYNRHLLTRKHNMEANGSIKKPQTYLCSFCNKEYRSRGSLWKHENHCNKIPTSKSEDIDIDAQTTDVVVLKNTIVELVKQNNEFKQLLVEQNQTLIEIAKKDTTTNNNNNTINNNQKFNLNFFLNNTCKDAMNMSEFIENIEVQFKDN